MRGSPSLTARIYFLFESLYLEMTISDVQQSHRIKNGAENLGFCPVCFTGCAHSLYSCVASLSDPFEKKLRTSPGPLALGAAGRFLRQKAAAFLNSLSAVTRPGDFDGSIRGSVMRFMESFGATGPGLRALTHVWLSRLSIAFNLGHFYVFLCILYSFEDYNPPL